MNLNENVCLSGGAIGADTLWGYFAEKLSHSVIHFNFEGHKCKVPLHQQVCLPRDKLLKADSFLKIAKLVLNRSFPSKSEYVNNLLRRNYYQVETSERCYAISSIKDGLVQGGTAWAVVLFTHILNYEDQPSECYVFCQMKNKWYKWGGNRGWVQIEKPPVPHGIWTGIGTREITDNGIQAIIDLMDQSVLSESCASPSSDT